MPKVSVIIPNYNHARFLDQRLETVFNQTFTDFEVIFLDDASTDNSLEIFKKYARDKRITQVVLNKTNSGSPFKQWDRGIKLAKGEYIWIAESDDYADTSFLAELVKRLDSNPSVGVAYCQSWITAGRYIESFAEGHEKFFKTLRWRNDFISKGKDEIVRYLAFRNTIHNASAVLFRRKMAKKDSILYQSMRLCGDWVFWADLLNNSQLDYCSKPLNYHRLTNSSSTIRAYNSGIGLVESYKARKHIVESAGGKVNIRTMGLVNDQIAHELVSLLVTGNLGKHFFTLFKAIRIYDPVICWRIVKDIFIRFFKKISIVLGHPGLLVNRRAVLTAFLRYTKRIGCFEKNQVYTLKTRSGTSYTVTSFIKGDQSSSSTVCDFSIIVLVNSERLYQNLFFDLSNQFFNGNFEVIALWNHGNYYKGCSEALNCGNKLARGKYCIYCHQDLHVPRNWLMKIKRIADSLPTEQTGFLGIAGKTVFPGSLGVNYMSYLHGEELLRGGRFKKLFFLRRLLTAKTEVQCLDELCLISSRKSPYKFDEKTFDHYHWYGADICLQALADGRKNYAINAGCVHRSNGVANLRRLDHQRVFIDGAKELYYKWINIIPKFSTTTANFDGNRKTITITHPSHVSAYLPIIKMNEN